MIADSTIAGTSTQPSSGQAEPASPRPAVSHCASRAASSRKSQKPPTCSGARASFDHQRASAFSSTPCHTSASGHTNQPRCSCGAKPITPTPSAAVIAQPGTVAQAAWPSTRQSRQRATAVISTEVTSTQPVSTAGHMSTHAFCVCCRWR